MASIFNHPRSKYWYIQFRASDGKVKRQSTKILKDSPNGRRKALQIAAEVTAREFARHNYDPSTKWDAWVLPMLDLKYTDRTHSHLRRKQHWNRLRAFLEEKQIKHPSQVRYQHAAEYMEWRKKSGAHHNTARMELVYLGMIMREAVRREYATSNPLAQLGIKKIRPPEKPELSDEDIAAIREALVDEPDWMRISFEIALYTGCRLRETRIAFKDIDLNRRLITFRTPKGGAERAFTVRFPEELLPLLLQVRDSGKTHTLDFPTVEKYPNVSTNHWHLFFKEKMQRPDLTFHCTRVTYITRHARKGTDERIVMRQVNHSSTLVHRIYSRLRAEDVSDADLQIGLPGPLHAGAPISSQADKRASRQSKAGQRPSKRASGRSNSRSPARARKGS